MKSTIFLLLLISTLFISMPAKSQAKDPDFRFSDKVQFEKVDILKMKVHFPAGELFVNTHNAKFFKADCNFSEKDWQPEIFYERRNDEGRLLLDAPEFDFPISLDDEDVYRWNLVLSRAIPTDLRINMKAGTGELNLNDMNLRRFEFTLLGGEIDLNLRNSSPERINFRALAGEAKVDLSGIYKNNLKADFMCGFGELTLYLPKETACQVEIDGVLGEIDAPSFGREGEYFVNSVKDSDHRITISITGGIGEVHLEQVGN